MLNQGQMRVAVVVCLGVIVVLLALNLKYKAMSPSLTENLFTVNKASSPSLVVVKVDQEEAYNKDLTNIRRKGLIANLGSADLTKWSEEELILTIHTYTDNTDIMCGRKLRMGNIGDGGWEICDDPDVRPRQPCIIYSFGINYDFSFDDDAANVYGCHVYAFDPSMAKMADKVERSNLVHFYKIGLSDTKAAKNGWNLDTLGGIRTMLGHQNKTIDVMKIDIESSEWNSVPEMINSGQLKGVRQLMLEYHITGDSKDYLLPRLQVIQSVEKAGFKRYYVHKNPACGKRIKGYPIIRTQCYEIHYIQRSL